MIRSIDWAWIWIVAVCCCSLGGLQAFDRAVVQDVSGLEYQSFLILLKDDVTPRQRMQLRDELHRIPWIHQIKWLRPEEVLSRVVREEISKEQLSQIRDQIPIVVELLIPTQALVEEQISPSHFNSFPQIDQYFWDENSVSFVREERVRWNLRSQKLQLGLMIATAVIMVISFMLSSHRNQLRLSCERASVGWKARTRAVMEEVYMADLRTWFRAMVWQAAAAVLLTFTLFLTFDQLLAFLESDSPNRASLLANASWGFLWLAGGVGFIGRGLDLFRVRIQAMRSR